MSKAKVKKELGVLDRDQLAELILTIYDVSKEAKEYLNFFADPDEEKFYDKQCGLLLKEMRRNKFGYSKMRITIVRQLVKKVCAYCPGSLKSIDFYLLAIETMGVIQRQFHVMAVFYKHLETLVAEFLAYASSCDYLDEAVRRLEEIYNNQTGMRRDFRSKLREMSESALSGLKTQGF